MDNATSQIPIPFHESSGEPIPDPGIAKAMDRIRESLEQKAIAAGLPVPSNGKPLPNDVLRSALFGVSEKVFRREEKIASVEGLDVYMVRGYRPTQAHLDVWEHCLALAAKHGTGKQIRFSAYSFLTAIGRTTGKSDYEWLKEAINDLAGCLVRISNGRHSYFGTLIQDGFRDEETNEYVIKINEALALLFMGGNWTALNGEQRKMLRKRPLAQWLHAFYSTHAKPHPYKVETIRQLCGSEVSELKKFRQMLRRALKELASVTGWSCSIDENDCVVIKREAKTVPNPYRDSG